MKIMKHLHTRTGTTGCENSDRVTIKVDEGSVVFKVKVEFRVPVHSKVISRCVNLHGATSSSSSSFMLELIVRLHLLGIKLLVT